MFLPNSMIAMMIQFFVGSGYVEIENWSVAAFTLSIKRKLAKVLKHLTVDPCSNGFQGTNDYCWQLKLTISIATEWRRKYLRTTKPIRWRKISVILAPVRAGVSCSCQLYEIRSKRVDETIQRVIVQCSREYATLTGRYVRRRSVHSFQKRPRSSIKGCFRPLARLLCLSTRPTAISRVYSTINVFSNCTLLLYSQNCTL